MTDENAPDMTERPETADSVETEQDEPKTFSADYVTGLRNEAKGHREKAQTLATRLHSELVRQTGRLADPTELPFDAAHLEDPDALNTAIDELLTRKPHYAARTPRGNQIGQGVKDQGQPADWLSQLKTLV